MSHSSLPPQLEPIAPSAERQKQARLEESFGSINKLKFDSVELVGREEEKKILEATFKRICGESDDTKRRELVLLSGASGTGKTALAETLRIQAKGKKGVFVKAKYDVQFRDNQPYSGIITVCNEMCGILLRKRTEDGLIAVREELFKRIDKSQIELLESVVPLLSDLVVDRSIGREETETKLGCENRLGEANNTVNPLGKRGWRRNMFRQNTSKRRFANDGEAPNDKGSSIGAISAAAIDPKDAKAALAIAFLRLIRILVNELKPVVIFLDDLQWADLPSLETIERILNDPGLDNVMLIGSYRSDEVAETHVLTQIIRKLKDGQEARKRFQMREVSVGALSVDSVNLYLNELLSVTDLEKTKGLAEICLKRTLGNIFFIRVFLLSLQDLGLLGYNTSIFQWIWDDSKVDAEASATDNLIGLLVSKMNKFSDEFLLLLKMASQLGNTFETSVISLLWARIRNVTEEETKEESIDELLRIAENELFIEAVDDCSYRFVHDKVQEASASLILEDERETFQHDIGTCLYEELDEDKCNQMLFIVVDLLNGGGGKSSDLARLNMEAAVKSMELSAFSGATRYVEMGINLLKESNMWSEHIHLALDLHSLGAEAEVSLGNTEKSAAYCKEVMNQKKILPTEKLRVYKIMIELSHSNRTDKKPNELCLELLEELGFKYPTNQGLRKRKATLYIRDTIKKFMPATDEVARMPFVSDPSFRDTVRLLTAAMPAMLHLDVSLYSMLCCDAVRLTKRHGLTEYSGSAFVSFANVLMHRLGDWATGLEVANVALTVQSRLTSNYARASVLHKANNAVFGWVKPLKSVWSGAMEAYQVGVLSGNVDCALVSSFYSTLIQFGSGTRLQTVLEDINTYSVQCANLNLEYMVQFFNSYKFVVLELMGKPPIAPKDTIMSPYCDITLYAFLGDYEKGAEIALEKGDEFYDQYLGFANYGAYDFPMGMCLYAHSNASKHPFKLAKAARYFRDKLRNHVKLGGVNFLHQLYILEAEDAILLRKDSLVRKFFNDAIKAGARSGFIHEVAFAHERYAAYLLSKRETSDAEYHYSEAIKYFSEWGAMKKVAMLEEKVVADGRQTESRPFGGRIGKRRSSSHG
mmetsp:Transcript_12203/g.26913  ORF Transcript_12203/g.26913 Transcript_12203/m.26913 type:complete len:1101 (+) Transcript_12203:105-3407(+)